ncbi:MAG: hypothetical protein H7A25_07850 [Leptospiraceae bacterium]|nr:hypothetical protein [Leptospiraceae bacterium]MCP5499798.1 hypothetical protein [Leptospiraceae bacterium]
MSKTYRDKKRTNEMVKQFPDKEISYKTRMKCYREKVSYSKNYEERSKCWDQIRSDDDKLVELENK